MSCGPLVRHHPLIGMDQFHLSLGARWRRGVAAGFVSCLCSARIAPIRANIVGPSCSATSIALASRPAILPHCVLLGRGPRRVFAQGPPLRRCGRQRPREHRGAPSVGLCADRAPYPVVKMVRNGLADGGPQHTAQDFSLDACVVPFGSGRCDACVELGHVGDGILSWLAKQIA